MFWTEEKLAARVKELSELRYRERRTIAEFECKEDEAGRVGEKPSAGGEWRKLRLGERWTGRDRYLWLMQQVEIPAEWTGRKVVGRFDFGLTGGGTNSGFESLLYVNGQPYQGVDSNHQEVLFPPDVTGKLKLEFRLWSGLGGYAPSAVQDHDIRQAELCWLDEAADDLYFTAQALLDVVKVLPSTAAERYELLSAADQAFLLLDWSRPGSESFYLSVAQAREALRGKLDAMPKHHAVTVRCIGHTHIDVAWLWRLQHTREKAARSFSTVLRLMEHFPDYTFLQTMPQLYDYIKTDYPEIYEQIRERVKEGRWEAGGGMWLEADCNLTSGESLVRQLLYGTRFLREEFGVECTYLWLPDVFGYSWALPQILRKSGIDTFMTTKISWNQYNRMPHDTFKWRGIDGTEVLTHFITTPDHAGGWLYTYNGEVTASSVTGIWEAYRDKGVSQELLLCYGYGDGGGGVNREMLEHRRRLSELPGVPQVTTGRVDDYFAKLQETVTQTKDYVHTWDGELYLELHRGTYTSQAYNKRMNRKLELLAREAEWAGVMGALSQAGYGAYKKAELDQAWKIVLRNQFHDIIPGSSIREVYEDARAEYEVAEELLLQVRAAGLEAWLGEGGTDVSYAAVNSAGWNRSALVFVPETAAEGSWLDAEGRELTAQPTTGGTWLHLEDVPALGSMAMKWQPTPSPVKSEAPAFLWSEQSIESPGYRVEWNEAGQITSLYDKANRREVLAAGAKGNVLQIFEDKPKGRHEAWDIDLFYEEKVEELSELVSVSLVENGPLRAVVRFIWQYRDSRIEQDLVLYCHTRRMDFVTRVDWHEQRKLLKAGFTVDIRSTEATYDVQFGNVKRPTHWNTSWDYARFEVVGHQWADLSERGYGVSLLNDSKYGYDIKDNRMRLTLLKSAMVPDPTADQGRHEFTYSLLPHKGDWLEGRTVQEAWDLNAPLAAVRSSQPHLNGLSLFRIHGGHVQVDAIKKAEDDGRIVLRLHEYAGARGSICITSDHHIERWQECDLMERPIADAVGDRTIELELKPYEIRTLLIDLKQG
jgi:alpha-mannosidase